MKDLLKATFSRNDRIKVLFTLLASPNVSPMLWTPGKKMSLHLRNSRKRRLAGLIAVNLASLRRSSFSQGEKASGCRESTYSQFHPSNKKYGTYAAAVSRSTTTMVTRETQLHIQVTPAANNLQHVMKATLLLIKKII